MSATLQIRLDDDLKSKSDMLFRRLGTDTTSAVRMFLVQAVESNGFPFEIKLNPESMLHPMTEDEILERLEKSRSHIAEGKFRNADDMIADMREKYGL